MPLTILELAIRSRLPPIIPARTPTRSATRPVTGVVVDSTKREAVGHEHTPMDGLLFSQIGVLAPSWQRSFDTTSRSMKTFS